MFKALREFLFGKPEVKQAQPQAPYKVEPPVNTVPRVLEAIESKPVTKASPAKPAAAKKPAPKKPVANKKPAPKKPVANKKPTARKTTKKTSV